MFLARAFAQNLETETISLDEAKASIRKIRAVGKTVSNSSILSETHDRSLKQVKVLHLWLEGKRQVKQFCRVVGESRTGKTIACNFYRLRHKPIQEVGKPPTVPVVYIQIPQECGAKDLFKVIFRNDFTKSLIQKYTL